MLEMIPFIFSTAVGLCAILFRKRLVRSVVRWQQKVMDVTTGERGIRILERCYLGGGVFFLLIGLLQLLSMLQ